MATIATVRKLTTSHHGRKTARNHKALLSGGL